MKAKTPDTGETEKRGADARECGANMQGCDMDAQGCGGTSERNSGVTNEQNSGGMQESEAGDPLFREMVERVVSERIRPSLRLHDGDMSIQEVRDGEIWVAFTGACNGCPSAQITLEEVVGQIFREELGNMFKSVHLVNYVDEDLLNFARHLLDKNK